MFWKKKKNKPNDPLHLEFEEGPRYFYRVCPAPERPVAFQVGQQRYPVENISAGGMSFRAAGMGPGQSLGGLLHLPDCQSPLPVVTTVRGVTPEGLVGVQFDKIRETDQERIHLYVLARQKEELEQRRREGTVEPEPAGGDQD